MLIDLSPCPFCGSEAKLYHIKKTKWMNVSYEGVTCGNEQCAVKPSVHFSGVGYDKEKNEFFQYDAKERAAKIWNTRV